MATKALTGCRQAQRSRNRSSSGKVATERQADAGRDARRRRNGRQLDAAPPGHRGHEDRKQRYKRGRKIGEKDITLFTRQLATMMKAGVPLLQAFDIVAKGTDNGVGLEAVPRHQGRRRDRHVAVAGVPQVPAVLRRAVLQPGRRRRAGRHPRRPARPAGDLQGEDARDQGQDQVGALLPDRGDGGRGVVVTVIMLFVIPAFKSVFESFGADLPAMTLMVIAMSDFFVAYWYLIFGAHRRDAFYFLMQAWRRSPKVQMVMDRLLLKLPVFGAIICKATIARWLRTLSTMFAAGVPLVEALDSVGGASAGNHVYLSDQEDPAGGIHRHQPDGVDAERRRVPEHGAADDLDRRGVRLARLDARQGRRHLRARGRRGGRQPVVAARADDHGGARHADRRPGDRDVPADLQAGSGCFSRWRPRSRWFSPGP
jgi:hypothetical protein